MQWEAAVSAERSPNSVDPSRESARDETAAPEGPQFGVWKSIAFSLILISAVLGLAELGVRSWVYYLREEAEKYDPTTETFVLVPGVHRASGATVIVNSQGFVGKELTPDRPGLWRIVAVGDSCTFGAGDDRDTYPAVLGARLAKLDSEGRSYEVVNAGISGLNSGLALRRLTSKVLPLKPDVVTIYIGWNDLMKFDPRAQGETESLAAVARLIDDLWLVKGLRKLLFFYIRPMLSPARTGPIASGDFARFEPTVFEHNLLSIIEAVRAAGSKPVLLTLPTVVRPEMTVADLRAARVMFPYFASAAGVADLLELLGAYNREIRRIGDEQQVPVIDLARRFERLPTTRPYFWDTMHLSPKGMELAADEILAGLERERLLGSALPIESPGAERAEP
jgi:lysophospholipase L1-like esterase